jgi:hypothetical protein
MKACLNWNKRQGYPIDKSATGFVDTNKKAAKDLNRKNEAILMPPYTEKNR